MWLLKWLPKGAAHAFKNHAPFVPVLCRKAIKSENLVLNLNRLPLTINAM